MGKERKTHRRRFWWFLRHREGEEREWG